MDCIFCSIIRQEIPAKIHYQDDLVLVFDDINPQAPVHKLIIPKQHIARISDLTAGEHPIIGHMFTTAAKLADELGIAESGYRVVSNCNADGGQTVFHIHMHLLGGRKLTWPPG